MSGVGSFQWVHYFICDFHREFGHQAGAYERLWSTSKTTNMAELAGLQDFVAPRNNFRLARYKLRTIKQEPSETVDSFLKKVCILVKECKYTNTLLML